MNNALQSNITLQSFKLELEKIVPPEYRENPELAIKMNQIEAFTENAVMQNNITTTFINVFMIFLI